MGGDYHGPRKCRERRLFTNSTVLGGKYRYRELWLLTSEYKLAKAQEYAEHR